MPAEPTASAPRITDGRITATTLGVAALAALSIAAVVVGVPELRDPLLREEGVVERASAAVLAGALVVAVVGIVRGRARDAAILLAMLALVELLDELSYGSRILGFRPVELWDGERLDGVHDLLTIASHLLGMLHPAAGLAVVALFGAAALWLLLLAAVRGRRAGTADARIRRHVLLLVHLGLLGVALTVDALGGGTPTNAAGAVEEGLEFCAALALLGAAATTLVRRR